MKSRNRSFLIVACILAIPWAYLISIYHTLPATVPLHFDINGHPNDYGSKTSLIWIIAGMTAVAIGIFFLMRNIKKIDPKKNVQSGDSTFNKIGLGIVIFIAALIVMITMAVSGHLSDGRLFLPALGIFFAFMGNVMYSVKPNYLVGIRLPWTLESEDNWRKTHQLTGKLWFGGGLFISAFSLLLNQKIAGILFFFTIGIIIIIPVVYSFMEFKKSQKTQQ